MWGLFVPRCRKCGTKMQKFPSSGVMIYLCPRRDVHPRPWQRRRAQPEVTRERITEPIKLSRPGDLLHIWTKTHPPVVDTQVTAAIKMKNYAPRKVR